MPINPKKTSPLRPLPMRITELQWERLKAARDYDDIAIQEHVRRALDKYLDMLDGRRERRAGTPTPLEELPDFVRTTQSNNERQQAEIAAAVDKSALTAAGRRRVVYR